MGGFFGVNLQPGNAVQGRGIGGGGFFGQQPRATGVVLQGPFTTVVSNNGAGVVLGAAPKLSVRDSNGIWTPVSVAAQFGNQGLNGIVTTRANPGQWAALSSRGPGLGNGLVAYSANAFTYAPEPSGSSINLALNCGAVNSGLWCIAGDGFDTHTSPDGQNWTTHVGVLPFVGSFFGNDMLSDGAQFVLCGQQTGNQQHATSANGVVWNLLTYQCNLATGIIFDGARFVSTVRTLANAPAAVDPIAGAASEAILPTVNTPLDLAFRAAPGLPVYCVIAGNSVIVANTLAGLAAGAVTPLSAGTLRSICCTTGGIFIAVDDLGVAYTSFDTVTWSAEDPLLGAVFLSCIESG